MKRLLYILISVLMLFAISACGTMSSTGEAEAIEKEVQTGSEATEKEVQTESEAEAEDTEEAEDEAKAETETENIDAEEPKEDEESSEQPALDLSGLNLEYGQQEAFKQLYDQIQPMEQAESFEGSWKRTDVVRGVSAEIIITDQTAEGFSFVGDFYYFSHSGWMEGIAYFVAPNAAVYEYSCDWEEEMTEETEGAMAEYLVFEKTQEGMQVYASAASADLGFGMNVFADGKYVQGEPEYTNATVFEDSFTIEVQEEMQGLLGDAYEDCFKTVVEIGAVTSTPVVLEDGTGAMFYEAYIPTMGGYAFELLVCEGGELYFNSELEEVGWRTNVEGAIDYPAYTPKENQT